MSLRSTWIAVLALAFASCAKPAKELVEAGNLALGRSDYDSALSNFGDALDKLDAKSPEWFDAKWGAIQALVYVDAPRAKKEFVELAQSNAVALNDYIKIAGDLSRGHHFPEAVDLVAEAKTRFPNDHAKLEELADGIANEATKAADPKARAAADELRKMGYLSSR